MILVVADAGPIRYLVVTGFVDVLPRLFDRIVIPEYVIRTELRDTKTPREVQAWASAAPAWVEVRAPAQREEMGLHRGESDAIALAMELKAFAVLLDDADAREVAARKGLAATGTIGILEKAAERGLLNLAEAFHRLSSTNFRIAPELLQEALNRDAERTGRQ